MAVFLQFLNFRSFPLRCSGTAERFRNCSTGPYYYRYHFCFHIPHALNFCYEIFLYFKIFLASFLITFLSPGTARAIYTHVPILSSWIMLAGFLLGMVLSVRTCWFHNMVTLRSRLVSTGTGSYRCLLSDFTAFPCVRQNTAERTLYRVSLCTVLCQYWAC